MHSLIRGTILKKLGNPILRELADSARLKYKEGLAFTTDSFVVSPIFFPGGDIGKLAVCGTVNDLVMLGAEPEYLSLALIIEEGLEQEIFKKVIDSLSLAAGQAGVSFVTGDLKVVEKGACDKIFINTSGIGRIIPGRHLAIKNIRPGDSLIITGNIAEHGLAVLSRRKELDLDFKIKSDCAALNGLLIPLIKKTAAVRFMRDPTRGGLAATLNEIARASGLAVILEEKKIPISSRARVACELLGIEPLSLANEGKAILVVSPKESKKTLSLLNRHPLGRNARQIGRIASRPKAEVILSTLAGSPRIIDMPSAEPLPRIC